MGGITESTLALCDRIIEAATTFIDKVDSGRAKSIATYNDMVGLRAEAQLLKDAIQSVSGGPSHD